MKMLDRLDADEPPVIHGDGSQAYDFVHVADCAMANVKAMQAEVSDRYYNVGTGKRTSIKELAEMLLRLTGSKLSVRYEPAGLTFVKNRIGCPKRAAAEIGFAAQIPLEKGLRQLIDWRASHKAEVERRRRAVGL
jgi:UDP-glucose 4-epimerase